MPHNPGMTEGNPGPGPGSPPDDHDPVPIFRTWPRIYAAVLLCLAVVMAAIALFQHWSF
jgi:hypothetical protein